MHPRLADGSLCCRPALPTFQGGIKNAGLLNWSSRAARSCCGRYGVPAMNERVFHVSGKITRSDNGQGVPGLRVEAHDADTAEQPVLGFALTNRDGSYHIDLPAGDAACCDCRKIYITVRDRDCRLVHDGCADRRCCEPGKTTLTLDHKVEPQALWWHLARPLVLGPHRRAAGAAARDAGDRRRARTAARRRHVAADRFAGACGLRHTGDRRFRSGPARSLGHAARPARRGAALPRHPRRLVR